MVRSFSANLPATNWQTRRLAPRRRSWASVAVIRPACTESRISTADRRTRPTTWGELEAG